VARLELNKQLTLRAMDANARDAAKAAKAAAKAARKAAAKTAPAASAVVIITAAAAPLRLTRAVAAARSGRARAPPPPPRSGRAKTVPTKTLATAAAGRVVKPARARRAGALRRYTGAAAPWLRAEDAALRAALAAHGRKWAIIRAHVIDCGAFLPLLSHLGAHDSKCLRKRADKLAAWDAVGFVPAYKRG
jgi:hypothetical protein